VAKYRAHLLAVVNTAIRFLFGFHMRAELCSVELDSPDLFGVALFDAG
jgi:hypothetical protein